LPDSDPSPPPETGPLRQARHTWREVPERLRRRFSDPQRFLFLCALAGVACGLAAVSFHYAIVYVFHGVWTLAHLAGNWVYLILALSPALGGCIVGYFLTRVCPEAAGSGIPQTKSAYYNDFGVIRARDGIFRFLLGTVFIGLGGSLGREGPTVHLCSAIASGIGRAFGLARARVQAMVPVGFGAGIAAAFNAPLSGIMFVIEELLDDFSTKALGGILVAVVIAAAIERSLIGDHSVFVIDLPVFATSVWMLVCIPLAVASAFLGHAFVISLLHVRARFKAWQRVPAWLRPGIGGLGVGLLGVSLYFFTGGELTGIFSLGTLDLDRALDGELIWWMLLLLFAGKFIAAVLSYASGGSGGVFLPTLFLGAMLGGLVGTLVTAVFPGSVPAEMAGATALLGMGTFFAATVRCPLTSIIIIFEMTRNYSLILPLMTGNILAYLIACRLKAVPLYDALLLQDRVTLRKMPQYQGTQDYRNLPVSTIMTYELENVRAGLTAERNLELVREHRHPHRDYPVVDAEGRLVGIVAHHELEEARQERPDAPVGELVAGQKLVTVTPETSIRDVANTLVLADVLQAPVVSKKDARHLLGIVTLHDIARAQNAINEQMGR